MQKRLSFQLWGRWPNATLVGLIALSTYFYDFLGMINARFVTQVVGYRFVAKHLLLLQFFDFPAYLLHPAWILGFVFSFRFVNVWRSKPFAETFLVLPEMQPKLFFALMGQVLKIAVLTEVGMRLAGWFYVFPASGWGSANLALLRRANLIDNEWSLKVVFGECGAFLCAVGFNGLFLFCASYVVFRIYRTRRWLSWALGLPVAVTLVQIALGPSTLSFILGRIAGRALLVNENLYYASAVLILLGIDVVLAKKVKRCWTALMDEWSEQPAH